MKKPTGTARPAASSPHKHGRGVPTSRAARRHAEAEARRAAKRKPADPEGRVQFYGTLLRHAGLIGEKAVAFHTAPQLTFALAVSGRAGKGRPGYCARCGVEQDGGVVLPFMGTVDGRVALLPPEAVEDPRGVRVALCHECVKAALTPPKPPEQGEGSKP